MCTCAFLSPLVPLALYSTKLQNLILVPYRVQTRVGFRLLGRLKRRRYSRVFPVRFLLHRDFLFFYSFYEIESACEKPMCCAIEMMTSTPSFPGITTLLKTKDSLL